MFGGSLLELGIIEAIAVFGLGVGLDIYFVSRFVNMIAVASAKLEKDKIWAHVKALRKEYYRKSPSIWPNECYGFLIMSG